MTLEGGTLLMNKIRCLRKQAQQEADQAKASELKKRASGLIRKLKRARDEARRMKREFAEDLGAFKAQ